MREDDFIVSKTDLKGRITYGNRIFMEFSGWTEKELLGSQHNIVRHPDMPRAVFKLLWDTIQAKRECNAFVKDIALNGGERPIGARRRGRTPEVDIADHDLGGIRGLGLHPGRVGQEALARSVDRGQRRVAVRSNHRHRLLAMEHHQGTAGTDASIAPVSEGAKEPAKA